MRLQRRKRRTEINIVPLVDVLIVLIFFFLISMQFRRQDILNIKVPEIETAGKNVQLDQIEIAVNSEGELFYNGSRVNEEELRVAVNAAAGLGGEQPVLLIGDEESQLKSITLIMDICREAGLEKIRLQSR